MAMSPLALVAGFLTSFAEITKGADGDTSATIAHGLGAVPEYVNLVAVSGTEAAWRVSAVDATNITLTASNTAGTANSKVRVVAGIRHSSIK